MPATFTVTEALNEGVTPRRLQHVSLYRPTRGVRATRPPETVEERVAELLLVLPDDAVFSHVTAARLLGLWLPTAWQADELIHISRAASRPKVRRKGVVSHAVRGHRELAPVGGLTVTSPADTWADLVGAFEVDDLVILADSTMRHRAVMTSPDRLAEAVERVRVGRANGKEALRLARPGSGSAMETRVRLLAARAGLPEPELNGRVSIDGEYIGAFDLVWRDERVIVEYDGDYHRTDRDQWQRDKRRLGRVQEDGWRVIVLTVDDVFVYPDRTVARIRAALRV